MLHKEAAPQIRFGTMMRGSYAVCLRRICRLARGATETPLRFGALVAALVAVFCDSAAAFLAMPGAPIARHQALSPGQCLTGCTSSWRSVQRFALRASAPAGKPEETGREKGAARPAGMREVVEAATKSMSNAVRYFPIDL